MTHNSATVSLIAAIGKNRELGRRNELIFKIPEDMKFFREKTRGHAIIMGRKTFESIGRPLPNRLNIVVTHNPSLITNDQVRTAGSIDEALELAKENESPPAGGEIFVIGGEQTYRMAMPFADKLYLTLVDAEVEDADAFFPEYSEFKTVSERNSNDENFKYKFVTLEKS